MGSLSFTVSETVPSDRWREITLTADLTLRSRIVFSYSYCKLFLAQMRKNNFIFCAVSEAVITGNKNCLTDEQVA